jgi:ankyrin repeat protein
LLPDIFHAAQFNDVEELFLALQDGQRLDERKRTLLNMTPAHIACISSSTEFMIAACSEPSLNPWARDSNGRTPFDHAAAKGNRAVMKALLPLMHPRSSLEPSHVVDFPEPR